MSSSRKNSIVHRLLLRALKSEHLRSAITDIYPELLNRIQIFSSTLPANNVGTSAYQTYKNAVWVYRAATIWGMVMSSLTVRVVDAAGKPVKNAKLDALLAEPNPDQPASEFWNGWGIEMALRGWVGSEFVEQSGGRMEMWLQTADRVTVVASEETSYCRVAYYTIDKFREWSYDLTSDEFCLYKFYNPNNPFIGLAPLDSIRFSAENDLLASLWQYNMYRNGARPDYVLEASEMTTPSERKALEETLAERHGMSSGSWNVGKPIVLPGGMKINPVSFKADDLAWKSLKEMSRDEIAGAYGIPDELMGYGKNTYENFDHAERVFWSMTAIPMVHFRDGRLTHWARRRGWLARDHSIATDLSKVVPLRRVYDPIFAQALKLFTMGAPFAKINEYLGMGFPSFQGDENSYPFGTQLSFDASGNVIDQSGATVANREKFFEIIKRVLEAEYENAKSQRAAA